MVSWFDFQNAKVAIIRFTPCLSNEHAQSSGADATYPPPICYISVNYEVYRAVHIKPVNGQFCRQTGTFPRAKIRIFAGCLNLI